MPRVPQQAAWRGQLQEQLVAGKLWAFWNPSLYWEALVQVAPVHSAVMPVRTVFPKVEALSPCGSAHVQPLWNNLSSAKVVWFGVASPCSEQRFPAGICSLSWTFSLSYASQ